MIDTSHADIFSDFFKGDFFHALITFLSVYLGSKHGTQNGNGK